MKTLTTQQIETLKTFHWVEVVDSMNNKTFMSRDLADQDFLDLTGVDLESLYDSIYLPVSNRIRYYKSTAYKNGEKYFLQYIIFVDGVEWARGNFAMFVGDTLELYTPKTEPTEEKPTDTDWRNLLGNVLENALKETDVDSIVEFIDNNFCEVSNKIRENFSDNLEVDDIGEVLKYDIASDWIEQNPDEAYDRAVDKMDSYEMRDKIIDYLQNNL